MANKEYVRRIRDKMYSGDCKQTDKGSNYICQTSDGGYLHSLFYGLNDKEARQLVNALGKIKKNGPYVSSLVDFLRETNGGLLYAGSLNLFGFVKRRREEDSPTSIIEMNQSDCVAKCLNQVIYIGNMPYIDGGNMNLYLNVETGLVVGYYDNQIVVTWTCFDDFIKEIISRYEEIYDYDGRNKNYGQSELGVFNNIQKFSVKE